MFVEYKVRPVTRYIVTSFMSANEQVKGGSSTHGEFSSSDVAYEVAYALCRAEHESLGYAPGDERIRYPERVTEDPSV